jgi:Ulp1 family protease
VVLTYDVVKKLLQEGRSPYLDRYQNLVKNYRYIVGPHLINQNHWLALIIDLETSRFFLLDPLLMESPLLKFAEESWTRYYFSRKDHDKNTKWNDPNNYRTVYNQRSLQSDNFNCGVYVIKYITTYVITGNFTFDNNDGDLSMARELIATTIETYQKDNSVDSDQS